MCPSTPTRVAPRVTILPEAGRDEMMKQWGLNPSAHWPEIDEQRVPGDSPVEGEDGWDDPEQAARDLESQGFLLDGGWHAVTRYEGGSRDGGMTTHRGVLRGDEYVDVEALRAAVERELGFTYEQVRSVYRQGPLTDEQRELRGKIDARLLALSRAGGELNVLARALGMQVKTNRSKGDSSCWVMERAIARARAAEVVKATEVHA